MRNSSSSLETMSCGCGSGAGSGITLACGTGACASAAAAVREGLCRPGEDIQVHLDGGTLRICVFKDGDVVMTGPAETVYEGETTDGEAECAL